MKVGKVYEYKQSPYTYVVLFKTTKVTYGSCIKYPPHRVRKDPKVYPLIPDIEEWELIKNTSS